jgi:hypothetical protein
MIQAWGQAIRLVRRSGENDFFATQTAKWAVNQGFDFPGDKMIATQRSLIAHTEFNLLIGKHDVRHDSGRRFHRVDRRCNSVHQLLPPC